MQQYSPFKIFSASAGSGKTFTLVKEYLKLVLQSQNPYKFQQILAITFTNKAAGEMKERVIENLRTFSTAKSNNMLSAICEETNLTEEEVFQNSKKVLNAILQNYSAFGITTIDSFTHKIIRTFAYDLKLPMNFDVEMDAQSLLNEAVDVVISKIGENKELTNLLVNYAIQKLDDDKSWDISLELKEFASIILNENDAVYLKSLNEIPINDFTKLKGQLQKENKKIEEEFKTIGENGLSLINSIGVDFKDFYYALIPKHFQNLATDYKKAKFFDQSKLKLRLEEELYFSKSKSDDIKNAINSVISELIGLYEESEKLFQKKTLNDLLLNSLIPLAVLSYVNNSLQELKSDNNILLNAEFNQLIRDTIKDEPAPFIYERLGEKYKYYFLDEMQDTSQLQWNNLIPLIENAITSENELGQNGQLLLVGDAKQSIYRWRGGDPEQFISLSLNEKNKQSNPFYVVKKVSNLETNYRSYSEVIEFNNSFFKHISQFLSNKNHSDLYFDGNSQKINNNLGGFVQLSFVEIDPKDEERNLVYPKKVLETIQNLDDSFQKNEICVLVRTKKQGVAIADFLSENKIDIISSETLLIKNNNKVDFIINLISVIDNPLNNELKIKLLYFLFDHLNIKEEKHFFISKYIDLPISEFFEKLKDVNIYFNYNEFIQTPFYESFEYIIRNFKLATNSDSEIQFFLDVVFEYQQKKQASLSEFLDLWELKKDKLSIVAPETKDAVRIMTIHKAKGLEFPVVIYPYDIEIYSNYKQKVWYNYTESSNINSILVSSSSKLNYIGKEGVQLFKNQKEEQELDNFNILYVALTRAVEQLYIISEKKKDSKKDDEIKKVSELFVSFLKQNSLWDSEKTEYNFGDTKRLNIPENVKNTGTNQKKFISNSWKNHNISIVANSSLLWDTEQGKAVDYGNLIHEILSQLKIKNDIESILQEYLFKGVISAEEKDKLRLLLSKIVDNEVLQQYFNENEAVFTEQEILTNDKNIIIPDRLVVNKNLVTIIDYKTGVPNKKYHEQLLHYGSVLEELNYKIDKKILVYINEEITVEEV
ncbi:UvrD-helicase domain-containing protein [Lutibacter citreus]|uniref:UvrD-helicase domain-containing protein n=1 Tax=Lutibacter citreus TaxID=2138210 RepID=UPI000DBE240F|nr:UvrD-helicase domain-containing protein [Lutibacter citreus]